MRAHLKLPTPGTAIATIALIAAMSGAAYAGAGVGDRVGTEELKGSAVTTGKLHAKAVTTGKIANNAVTGAKAKESTFGSVPLADRALNAFGAVVRSDGTLLRAPQGNAGSSRTGTGSYIVDFGVDISACVYVATLGGAETSPSGELSTSTSTADSVDVQTRDSKGDAADRAFSVIVVC